MSTSVKRTRLIATGILVPLALLAGCGSDGPARESNPFTTASASSATSSPTVATSSPPASVSTAEAADAACEGVILDAGELVYDASLARVRATGGMTHEQGPEVKAARRRLEAASDKADIELYFALQKLFRAYEARLDHGEAIYQERLDTAVEDVTELCAPTS